MENETTPVDGTARSRGTVPAADVDFGTVVTNVAAKWTATPSISLGWTTVAEFTTQATAYNTELAARMQVGGGRSQITQALNDLDAAMDDALTYVKGYIIDRYKKSAAPSYYAAFGIEHKKIKYVFPRDRNKRLASLDLMLTAISDNGFGGKEYGTTFWSNIKTQYEALVSQASSTDGMISSRVSAKNTLKASLKKTLNSLITVIRANYPDTYKTELRTWGFQKEKY